MAERSGDITISLCTEKTQSWEELVSLPLRSDAKNARSIPVAKAVQEAGKDKLLAELLKNETVFSVRREFEGNVSVSTYLPMRELHFEFGTATPADPDEWKANIGFVITKLRDVISGNYRCVQWQNTHPTVYVVGHTDTVGSKTANQILSEKRAGAIANAIYGGSSALQICYAGRGEADAGTQDEVESPEARKADVTITSGDPPLETKWRCL